MSYELAHANTGDFVPFQPFVHCLRSTRTIFIHLDHSNIAEKRYYGRFVNKYCLLLFLRKIKKKEVVKRCDNETGN